MTFELAPLPYDYEALEPHISANTLKVHHDKHHQAYCDKFNAALEKEGITSTDFAEIFENVTNTPAIRNNGGGFWNHTFYWESMTKEGTTELTGDMKEAIERDFGSLASFKEQFSNAAATLFGSGWTWLGVNTEGTLVIYNTPNQDNYMMNVCEHKETPLLVLDVWEHAYYLDYQNKRPEYIEHFFSVINWDKVAERHAAITKQSP